MEDCKYLSTNLHNTLFIVGVDVGSTCVDCESVGCCQYAFNNHNIDGVCISPDGYSRDNLGHALETVNTTMAAVFISFLLNNAGIADCVKCASASCELKKQIKKESFFGFFIG